MTRSVAAAALVVALAASLDCSSSSGTAVGPVPIYDSGLACGPVDVVGAGYDGAVPEPMRPPRPPHANRCTALEVQDYARCQGAKDTDLCPQFAPGGAAADCGACVESSRVAADGGPASAWGVIVFDSASGTASFDIEGCVDDALGQVGLELANGGAPPGSCGDRLFASYGCQGVACGACAGSPIDTCPPASLDAGEAGAADLDAASEASACQPSDFVLCARDSLLPRAGDAAAGQCASYDDAVTDPSGPCAALFGPDAPTSDASHCFPDASILDPTQQETDWLERIVGYMCGPPS